MCKEIQPVRSEGDQPWDFFGRNDAKAETPVLWPPHAKSCLIGKDFDAGRDWGQEEKWMTEGEMAGWHHWLDGCDSATPWIAARQASLSITNSQNSLRLNVHQVCDAIQPSHPLSTPSPPAPNPSQHQSLFQFGTLDFWCFASFVFLIVVESYFLLLPFVPWTVSLVCWIFSIYRSFLHCYICCHICLPCGCI